jgi:hypothetical protein
MTPKKALKKWVKLFKLQSWDIKLETRNEYEDPELEGNDGYARMRVADLEATIVINEDTTEPVEDIIIHECIHLLLRDTTVVLNALFHTQDAEDVFNCVDELLTRRLEFAFKEVVKSTKG